MNFFNVIVKPIPSLPHCLARLHPYFENFKVTKSHPSKKKKGFDKKLFFSKVFVLPGEMFKGSRLKMA